MNCLYTGSTNSTASLLDQRAVYNAQAGENGGSFILASIYNSLSHINPASTTAGVPTAAMA